MNSSQSEKRSRAKDGWIKELKNIYFKNITLQDYYNSHAPHPRIEGQFGRSVSTEGYNTVVVYIQLSKSIDFEMLQYFLKVHLLSWNRSDIDSDTDLKIIFFYDEQDKLIIKKMGKINDFIDNTLKKVEPGNIRYFNKYKYGWIPGANDFIIFITDKMGCKVNNETSSRLSKYKKRVVWITLEKDSKVKVKQSKMPSLYEERYQEVEMEGYPEYVGEESGKKRGTKNMSAGEGHFLDNFFLYFSQKSLPAPFGDTEIEIFGNGLMRKGNTFFPQFCEKFCIPKEEICKLKMILKKAGIFQIRNNYSSNSIDGTYWEMKAHIDGQKVQSKGHNNYPPNWNIIHKAILDCISKAKKITMNRINPNNIIFSILEKNPPLWWNNLKNDKEIVIEIRSDKSKSYIDCYYNGGCILGGLNCDGKGNFKGKIHYKYIPIKINKGIMLNIILRINK